jgi:hypothetical protein
MCERARVTATKRASKHADGASAAKRWDGKTLTAGVTGGSLTDISAIYRYGGF